MKVLNRCWPVNVTTSVMQALRRDLYPPHKYVWATEVTVDERRMDATTIDTSKSPFYLEGFEVKVSRADWLNDKGSHKSTPARNAVDRFWFVFGSADIYKVAEVPPECGIIHIADEKAVKIREAAQPGSVATYCRALMSTILTRTLRTEPSQFVNQVDRDADARGDRKGLAAAKRRSPVIAGRETRLKYDPGRFNFDDGVPLDLP
jgi:hypothetical protein